MIPRSIQHHPTPGKNFASGDLAGAKRLAAAMRRLTAGLFLAAWVPFGALAEDMTLTLADGVEMGLVWIGPGEFAMGGIRPLPHDSGGEKVKVRLSSGFYLGRTEITQQQWVSIMGSRPWEGRPHVVADPQRPAVFFFVAGAAGIRRTSERRHRPTPAPADGGRVGIRLPRR